MPFTIGQTFDSTYPPEAAEWCMHNNAYIEEVDGSFVIKAVLPPTEEEMAAQALAEARAQSSTILMARMQADMVQTGAFAAAEFATFAKAGLFADWAAGQTYAKGYRLAHKGIVYEVMQEVTAIENQPPDAAGMLAVYRPLSVDPETGDEPDGSREHPYAFLYGMDVTKGSYYSYDGKLWRPGPTCPPASGRLARKACGSGKRRARSERRRMRKCPVFCATAAGPDTQRHGPCPRTHRQRQLR